MSGFKTIDSSFISEPTYRWSGPGSVQGWFDTRDAISGARSSFGPVVPFQKDEAGLAHHLFPALLTLLVHGDVILHRVHPAHGLHLFADKEKLVAPFVAFVTCQAENSERDLRASIRYWSIYIIPLSRNNVAVPVARKAFINSIADSYAACSVFFLYSSGILSISA